MKKELNEEQKELISKAINNVNGDEVYNTFVDLMKRCHISDSTIMMTAMGIGSHTEYYKVLINRINNNRDKVNESWIKKQVIEIFHEIDRKLDEEEK